MRSLPRRRRDYYVYGGLLLFTSGLLPVYVVQRYYYYYYSPARWDDAFSAVQTAFESFYDYGKLPPFPAWNETVIQSLAGLQCDNWGGPFSDDQQHGSINDAVEEMVYWKDIPQDARFVSPLKSHSETQYLTFEPDEGGFNNVRMAFETAVALAVATGRTLVLPPRMGFYLLTDEKQTHKYRLGLQDFYDLGSIAAEHHGLDILPLQEFLEKEAMTGHLIVNETGKASFPPENRTNWDGFGINMLSYKKKGGRLLWDWLRSVSVPVDWDPMKCIAGIPDQPGPEGVQAVVQVFEQVQKEDAIRQKKIPSNFIKVWRNRYYSFDGNPAPVNAPPVLRMSELLADREHLCLYDVHYQKAKLIHIQGEQKSGSRMLVHHYAFLFYQSWEQQVWMQRFVRDHLRYRDEIQCAAARVVEKLREISLATHGNERGGFDSAHIRRGDFQFKAMWISAENIYEMNMKKMIQEGRILYIATDEKHKSFFAPLRKHYKVYFLQDFLYLLRDLDAHYLGMIDQLVAAKADKFVGTYFSTFTGYINRIRGYHNSRLDGAIDSYYYVPQSQSSLRKAMREYHAVEPPFWQREFPVAWRDIDHNIKENKTAKR